MCTSLEIILAVGTSQTSDKEIKSPNEDILSAPEEKERNLMRQRSIHIGKHLQRKIVIFAYLSVLTFVLGAQKNCLNETVLLSIQNICFG